MCHITQLYCQVCKTHGTFLFNFCENVANDEHFGKLTPTAYKLYCPDFIWPPENLTRSKHICDSCLKNGVVWYAMAEQRVKLEKTSMKTHGFMNVSYLDHVVDLDGDSEDNQDSAEEKTGMCGITGGFHETWKDINPLIKKLVVNTYRSIKRRESDPYWESRINDGTFRTLKLYIPFCKICKRASLSTEGGLDGVEMEPDAVLWKWMFKLRDQGMIETHLSTDFMIKPCSRCANNEIKLRHVVCTFLKDCTNQQAWALWRWLQMRGRGGLSFWCMKDMDTSGLSNTQPKDLYAYLRLMAEGWEDKAGSAWENFVDIDSAPTYIFPVMHYPETFLSLRQWRRFADLNIINMNDAEPFVQSPAPPLLSGELPTDQNPRRRSLEDVIIVEIGPEGVKYRATFPRESSQTITKSDAVAAYPWDELDGPTSKATHTNVEMAYGSTGTTKTMNDITQDDDDIFGDTAVGGPDFAVQHPAGITPTGITPTDGQCCATHNRGDPTSNVKTGETTSMQLDAEFEKRKDGCHSSSTPGKCNKKRKVHFPSPSLTSTGH